MKRIRLDILACIVLAICALIMAIWAVWPSGEVAEHEIAPGVTYHAFSILPTNEGSGLVHVVKIDLSAPGIDLYVTPVDPQMRQLGFEYRLAYVKKSANAQNLIAAINGGYFASDSRLIDMPGDRAIGSETDVSNHVINHDGINSYLMWFEDDLTPHVEHAKPPPVNALKRAKWGMSGQIVILTDGKINPFAERTVHHRTVAGIDPKKKLLWLVCADRCSIYRCAEILSDLGATDAIALDGGGSTTMVVQGKTVIGGWRPVATCLGVHSSR